MDAEKKQQLYGGEISDYYRKPTEKKLKEDYKDLENIYNDIRKKLLGLDIRNYSNDKLK
jgi:hypothetical protein